MLSEKSLKRAQAYARRKIKSCKRAPSLSTCRKALFFSDDPDFVKVGRLGKEDLVLNKRGKVVSKRKSEASAARYAAGNSLKRRNDFIRREVEAGRFSEGGEEEVDEEEMGDDEDFFPPFSPGPPSPSHTKRSVRASKGRTSKFQDYEVYGVKKSKKGRRR